MSEPKDFNAIGIDTIYVPVEIGQGGKQVLIKIRMNGNTLEEHTENRKSRLLTQKLYNIKFCINIK